MLVVVLKQNRKHKKFLADMYSLFGITDCEFRRNIKMVMQADGGLVLSHEQIHRDHHVEVCCTSKWVLAYLLMHMLPNTGVGIDKIVSACDLVAAFLRFTGQALPQQCLQMLHAFHCA